MAPSYDITESGKTTVETYDLMAIAVPVVYKNLFGFDVINKVYQAILQMLHK